MKHEKVRNYLVMKQTNLSIPQISVGLNINLQPLNLGPEKLRTTGNCWTWFIIHVIISVKSCCKMLNGFQLTSDHFSAPLISVDSHIPGTCHHNAWLYVSMPYHSLTNTGEVIIRCVSCGMYLPIHALKMKLSYGWAIASHVKLRNVLYIHIISSVKPW